MTEPNPNSMTIWWPVVERLGLPAPRTIMVPISQEMWEAAINGDAPPAADAQALAEAAERIGYPLFLRNDLTSGKHSWGRTCYVPSREAFLRHVYRVIEDAELHWAWPVLALAVREYVPLESTFEAFDGMPVSRERRYFADGGVNLCRHPYWPEEAIADGDWRRTLPEDWRDRLAALNLEREDEAVLRPMAEAVTRELGGTWSVDFARARDGRWLLIDMALAASSWHPEACPSLPKEAP